MSLVVVWIASKRPQKGHWFGMQKRPSCVEELADMCKMFLDLYITSLFLIGLDFGRQNKMMSMLLMMSNKGLCRKQGSNIIFPRSMCSKLCLKLAGNHSRTTGADWWPAITKLSHPFTVLLHPSASLFWSTISDLVFTSLLRPSAFSLMFQIVADFFRDFDFQFCMFLNSVEPDASRCIIIHVGNAKANAIPFNPSLRCFKKGVVFWRSLEKMQEHRKF